VPGRLSPRGKRLFGRGTRTAATRYPIFSPTEFRSIRSISLPAASLVVTNARISPRPSLTPDADSLAIREGRIVRLGNSREVERLAGPRTKVLDARGRRILPGFIDAHVHLIWGYELGRWIDLTGQPSLREVRRRVRRYAREHPRERILVGHGFDYATLSAEGLPGKEVLDEIVDDRPVLLTAWDGHTGWGNSAFFARVLPLLSRLGRSTGDIVFDRRTHEPTGVLHKTFDLTPHLPELRARRSVAGLRRMISTALGFGITTGFDVQVNLEDVAVYEALRRSHALPMRIRVALYHPRSTSKDLYPRFVAARERSHDDWLSVAAIKLYIDGVQETGTAALLEPYADNPGSRGSTVFSVPEYRRIVRDLDRLGFQILTHACGDRGVRIALDAYERAARVNRTRGRRHRIEHCENLAVEDIPRFAQLDVVPCMMPRHSAPELTGRWRSAVGPERTRSAFAWRELLSAGAPLAFSSDWPVAELNPMVGIHAAVNRVGPDGEPSPHRLTVAEAVRAYTEGAAYASHCEEGRGALALGAYGDLILLEEDPFEVRAERLRSIRVATTIVGGRVVSSGPDRGPLGRPD
jgi:predicted amidohydrolase YtcJ